jgi:hypothetical protein
MTPLMRNTRSGWIHLGLFAVLTGLTAIGCSASVPKGKITGTVTYEGKPLESGVITFMPAKTGLSVSAEITNGQYTASEVPQGELYVTVVSVKQAGMTEADIKAEIERKKQSARRWKNGQGRRRTRSDSPRLWPSACASSPRVADPQQIRRPQPLGVEVHAQQQRGYLQCRVAIRSQRAEGPARAHPWAW